MMLYYCYSHKELPICHSTNTFTHCLYTFPIGLLRFLKTKLTPRFFPKLTGTETAVFWCQTNGFLCLDNEVGRMAAWCQFYGQALVKKKD